MIFPSNRVRIMVATKPVDFRKGHDGLTALVKNELHKDPFTGTVFVFRSRKADRLKLIYWGWLWDRHGLQTAGGAHYLARHQRWADDAGPRPAWKPCLRAFTGGGFMPFRRERRRPSNSCGKMTQHGKFQRQIGAGFDRFQPCWTPPIFPTMLPP